MLAFFMPEINPEAGALVRSLELLSRRSFAVDGFAYQEHVVAIRESRDNGRLSVGSQSRIGEPRVGQAPPHQARAWVEYSDESHRPVEVIVPCNQDLSVWLRNRLGVLAKVLIRIKKLSRRVG